MNNDKPPQVKEAFDRVLEAIRQSIPEEDWTLQMALANSLRRQTGALWHLIRGRDASERPTATELLRHVNGTISVSEFPSTVAIGSKRYEWRWYSPKTPDAPMGKDRVRAIRLTQATIYDTSLMDVGDYIILTTIHAASLAMDAKTFERQYELVVTPEMREAFEYLANWAERVGQRLPTDTPPKKETKA